jgi:hypothetical protein
MDNRHIHERAFERLTDAAADDGARFGIDEQLGHMEILSILVDERPCAGATLRGVGVLMSAARRVR